MNMVTTKEYERLERKHVKLEMEAVELANYNRRLIRELGETHAKYEDLKKRHEEGKLVHLGFVKMGQDLQAGMADYHRALGAQEFQHGIRKRQL